MRRFPQITTVLAALCAPLAVQAVPLEVAHQGELQDADGPVTDAVQFTFRLFDAEEDGNEVWTEVRNIDVVDGSYSVLLGSQTAIDSVLFTEPALWLEITVEGGSPMLPRQPVASAPYAIVANTAVNVDGGTVNASSISVGSTEVIDASGSWTGGAGSVDWSALTGAPADADTLGGLSCSDGDRAVWNDSSQLWECGSSTVTLDRLDTTAATSGQVLTYDGAQTAWEDAGAAGGCGLSAISERVAELTCGTTMVRVRIPGEYLAVTGPGDNVRLRSNGTITMSGGGAIAPPSGTYSTLSRGRGGSHYCGITASGDIDCQNTLTVATLSPPAGSYLDVACEAGDGWCCGVQTSGSVACWDIRAGGPYAPTPSGSGFAQVAATNLGACARTTAGTVTCWGAVGASGDLAGETPSLAGVAQITAGRNDAGFTAVTSSGVVAHWTASPGSAWSSSIPAGTYVASGAAYGYGVFVRNDGVAVSPTTGAAFEMQGSYAYAGFTLMVRTDGTLAAASLTTAEPAD